jgi:hypothetical protein
MRICRGVQTNVACQNLLAIVSLLHQKLNQKSIGFLGNQ